MPSIDNNDVCHDHPSGHGDTPSCTFSDEPSYPSSDLERIGDKKQYIVYSRANADAFNAWWETTPWAKGNDAKGDNKVNICWHSKARTSKVWDGFKQVAEKQSGTPKVVCILCYTALEHPQAKNTGTTSMKCHLQTSNCRKRSAMKGAQQSEIMRYMGIAVCFRSL